MLLCTVKFTWRTPNWWKRKLQELRNCKNCTKDWFYY